MRLGEITQEISLEREEKGSEDLTLSLLNSSSGIGKPLPFYYVLFMAAFA